MEAQGNLNEEQLDDGQAAEVLADLNGNDIENQAPINHIDDYMRDYMMDKNKAFDNKLLDGSFNFRLLNPKYEDEGSTNASPRQRVRSVFSSVFFLSRARSSLPVCQNKTARIHNQRSSSLFTREREERERTLVYRGTRKLERKREREFYVRACARKREKRNGRGEKAPLGKRFLKITSRNTICM